MTKASSTTDESAPPPPRPPKVEYLKVPMPEPSSNYEAGARAVQSVVGDYDLNQPPPARSIEESPQKDSSAGILNAIDTVYKVALARRAYLLTELKKLDDALAPFANMARPNDAGGGYSPDKLQAALLQFADLHKGEGT